METNEKNAPITGKEGGEIDIKTAAEWTRNYRERHPSQTISQFFGVELIKKIIEQPGCLGIRIYYANSHPTTHWHRSMMADADFAKNMAEAHGEDHVILAGVTKEGLDQLPGHGVHEINVMAAAGGSSSGGGGTLVEQAHPCPGSIGCPKNALTGD